MRLAALLTALSSSVPASGAARSADRLVHRFVELAVSPDGAHVASVEGDVPPMGRHPELLDLVIRSVEGQVAVTVALPCGHVAQCWPGSPSWAPDGKRLAFALRTPGSHARSVYEVAADGTGLTKLLDFGGTLEALKRGPSGQLAMLATENARKEVGAAEAGAPVAGDLEAPPAEQRIAILEDGGLRFVSPPDLFVYEYEWLPGGKGFVGTAAPGDGDDHWWIAKLYAFPADDGGARVLYAPTSPRQQLATPRVSRDGRTVAFIAGLMSDFGVTGGDVYTVPTGGGAAVNVTPELKASATAIGWGCDGRLQAQLIKGSDTEIVDLGDGRSAAEMQALWQGTEALKALDLTAACPTARTAASHETFTAPPELEAGSLGNWHDLTHANAGLTMPARAQSLTWRSGVLDVHGWLLLPEHAKGKVPMVTVVHGGPAGAYEPHFDGPGVWRDLLERGYAVFLPNPRGSFGQGERFTAANVRDFGHGDLRDILAGIDAAERAAPIDDRRLGITGHSYGGFMTMWAVTQTHRFKAAVAGAGIANWLSYYGENGIDAWLIPYFGASAYVDPAAYARSSPIDFIRKVRTPTFEYVGECDVECPAPQTQEFWHALKDLGVPTASVIFPGEGHSIRNPAHLAEAERRTIEWFEKYLH